MEPFIGEVRLFPYQYAPEGWAPCDGQLLPVQAATALFTLLGNRYGGDGQTNFALPKMGPVAAEGGGQLGYFIAILGFYPPRS